MSNRAGRRNQPGSGETGWMILGGLLAFVLVVVVGWWGAALLDSSITGPAAATDPITIISGQATGALPVTILQIAVFTAMLLVVLGLTGLIVVAALRQRKKSTWADRLARSMSRPKDHEEFFEKAATADAEKLGATGASIGPPLGRLVINNKVMRASWEWVQVWVIGPRGGKTQNVCVPQILETNGPVVATSNKPDIVDLTRRPRMMRGQVWVHDVQGIIGESPSWFWNPLSFVEDIESAEKLADTFVSSATSAARPADGYFESDGKRLLSYLLLAAAVAEVSVDEVYNWANDPDDPAPVRALEQGGKVQIAEGLSRIQGITPKQRDGIYGTMRPWISVLGSDKVIPWLRDSGVPGQVEFDHRNFHATTDTLYLISREGGGSARAITAALAMAVLSSAEKYASTHGGRLKTPLMAVLDETANVVRWRELPDLYSHYGSRGIVVSTFFQSFVQGEEAFGKEGMSKLWSAANIRVAGSGLSEAQFGSFLSRQVGPRDVVKRSVSTQSRGRSTSTSVQREQIFDEADIGAMPRFRALMFSSGHRPALLKLRHFSETEHAARVKESQEYYEGLREFNRQSV
ncbi:type IV secretory system conjugative DNA transfer family protein [Nesterenkonia sandarakina]|uniref:Type IV secretory pathway TraG/TraD family ATPase VirD4 n=1 Tax=Nesterenkonia sandarakina TaxID=272918 RepID=A0A2T0YAW9_9MICC|nr:TraM recognition domain-containing protein [Nesterenkonia sandarakina]PRZ11775.1 type IV secretory pathway TraG/TraD family ATPase VirD4 [Nesterenkonia sandarakina]